MSEYLKFGGISINHFRQGQPSVVTMYLFTKGGSLREASLTENELYKLAQESLRHAEVLRSQREDGTSDE